ncbi:FusB/FusC family EF-G-binding protein [Bacillus paramycoides]|uniref:FusB/FusC family EF-G-binding protein n=1 Tax=Bacillus paramycoides TaxID=2026194 RepID=A0ABU6MYF2_9BACI|nr:FusB/FusC family EF-G-binding protein [Bacillus paramycoides]MED0980349.1 FusB/FusC family EF-G-binding protein [Bacillus paramycoides]MED0985420.1 FusB/FusC family EF-G-binding protein [Bacillus paramycoides]MED1091668.1 FusB/FusC family EF-G-binding protein [Bacillus paramycoides]MED1104452.1 FusB/FusC family EF-G-binding protein [Bacillus paramycoides]
MEAFIRSDQYNFIKSQAYILANGHATANDRGVIQALKSLSIEKVIHVFENLTPEQKELIDTVVTVENREDAESFLLQINPYVIPFQEVTLQTLKKLFPKAKKLKLPEMEEINMKETSYLSWIDKGTSRKFIIAKNNNKFVGLQGTFQSINKKSICSLCHGHEEVGMFLVEIKGKIPGTFVKKGNYICKDSVACNHNMKSLDKLQDFIERLKK